MDGVKITGKHLKLTQEGKDKEFSIVFPINNDQTQEVIDFFVNHDIVYTVLDGTFMIRREDYDRIDSILKNNISHKRKDIHY